MLEELYQHGAAALYVRHLQDGTAALHVRQMQDARSGRELQICRVTLKVLRMTQDLEHYVLTFAQPDYQVDPG